MHLSDWWEGRYAVRGECWIWTGAVGAHGYGTYGRTLAHRRAYAEAKGDPGGDHVHHLCGERRCVRPEHLTAIDPAEHGRAHQPLLPTCKRGHAFTPENTTLITRRRGLERRCRRCHADRQRRYDRASS